MKKKLLAILGVVASLAIFAGCKSGSGGGNSEGTHEHTGGAATCTSKAVCEVCGEEYGELGAHTWGSEWSTDGTNHWHACGVCGEKADENAHTGGTATCADKAVCNVCGEEYGELGAHTWADAWSSDGTNHWHACGVCGEKADETAHTGGTATCTSKAVCEVCGEEYGERTAHTGGTATCTNKAVCDICGEEYGELIAHKGGTATCTNKAVCEVCGEEYGELNADNHASNQFKWVSVGNAMHKQVYACCEAENPDNKDIFCKGGTANCTSKAVCEVCGAGYGEIDLNNHKEIASWDKSADDKDVGTCVCGETVEFRKLFTDRAEMVWTDDKTLDLSEVFPECTISGTATFNGVALTGTIGAVDFSEISLDKHGDGNLEMTVVDKYGVEHTVTYALRVITDSFGSEDIEALMAAVRGVKNDAKADTYGFYRLTDDISALTRDGVTALYTADLPEGTGSTTPEYGFAGTLYGEKEDGTAPVITTQPRNGGLFGVWMGATLKNVVITDTWSYGTDTCVLAIVMQDCTVEDVTVKMVGLSDAYGTTADGFGKGWLVSHNAAGDTFKNVSFVNATGKYLEMARIFSRTEIEGKTTTFENCSVDNFASVNYIVGSVTVETVEGLTINNHVHDFVNGEYKAENGQHWKVCATCDVEDTENKTVCSGVACEETGNCAVCGNEYTAQHVGGTATCQVKAVCENCGNEYGELGTHTGGVANCTDLAVCEVCGEEYGEVDLTNHKGITSWDTSAEDKDIGICECGERGVEFQKLFTERAELVFSTGATTVDLSKSFPTGSIVSNVKLDGEELAGTHTLDAIDFSSLKDELKKHGDRTLTMTVTHGEFDHAVTYSVRLITGDIDSVVTMFNAVFAKDGVEKWGFYRVTGDFDYRTYFIKQDCGYNMDEAGDTTAQKGFHGTIYGEKKDAEGNITRPVITSQQRSNGVFGWLIGATVKDLIIVDEWASGVHPYSGALLAVVVQSSTISNVEFRLKTATSAYTHVASDAQAQQRKGWIVNRYCAWNTFENVSIVNVSSSVTTFAPLFGTGNSNDYTGMKPNTFKNCTITGAAVSSLGWQIDSSTGTKTTYTLENTSGITAI